MSTYSEVTLQPHQFAAQEMLDRKIATGPTLSEMLDTRLDALVRRVHLCVLGTKPEIVERSWPATWWDAVKIRWLPRWALAKWPACMENIRVIKAGLYPEIPWNGERLKAIAFLEEQSWPSFSMKGET